MSRKKPMESKKSASMLGKTPALKTRVKKSTPASSGLNGQNTKKQTGTIGQKKNVEPLKVFLLEDHPVMRLGLKMLLQERGFDVCGEAETPGEALRLLPASTADVAVFDLSLGGEIAIETIAKVRRRVPQLLLIVYSMHDAPLFIESAFRAGANGYVTKADPVESLIEAISAVKQGQRHLGPSLARTLEERFAANGQLKATLDGLSTRELEVVTLLGQGFGLSEIADRFSVSSRTIESHLMHLRQKLGAQNNRGLTRIVIQFLHPG